MNGGGEACPHDDHSREADPGRCERISKRNHRVLLPSSGQRLRGRPCGPDGRGALDLARQQRARTPSHPAITACVRIKSAQDAFADMLAIQQICVDDFAAAICIGTSIVPSKAGGPHDAPTLANAMLAAGKPVAVYSQRRRSPSYPCRQRFVDRWLVEGRAPSSRPVADPPYGTARSTPWPLEKHSAHGRQPSDSRSTQMPLADLTSAMTALKKLCSTPSKGANHVHE